MEMFDRFKNIPEDYVPCNLVRGYDDTDTIIWGGTTVHQFLLKTNLVSLISKVRVIYKQYTRDYRLIKYDTEISYDADIDSTIITCSLTPEETMTFDKHFDVDAQVQIETTEGETIFTRIIHVKMVRTLVSAEVN